MDRKGFNKGDWDLIKPLKELKGYRSEKIVTDFQEATIQILGQMSHRGMPRKGHTPHICSVPPSWPSTIAGEGR